MKSLDKRRLPALGISAQTRCKSSCCSATTCSSSRVTLNRVTMLALVLLCTSLSVVQTGPVVTRPRRMMREIYSEITDSSAQNVTNFIADTCMYDGTQVTRTSIVCQKKHGCRAIQKTGECCPDYQCECQRDGKTYANGEKVLDPETPCRVCYCQGGEFSCSQVTCYKRHDCEPKFISGRCCPEYDNCPPLESSKITEATSSKDETIELKETEIDAEDLLEQDQQPKTSTSNAPTSVATESSTAAKISIPAASNNPLGLKIKEITKAEEIRLTDNHPKFMTITTTTTTTTSYNGKDEYLLESSGSHIEEANNLEHLDMNITDDGDNGMKNVRHTDDDMLANGTAEVTDSGESSTAGPSESSEMEVSSESSSSTVRILTPSSTTAMPDDVSDEVTKKDKPLPAVVQIGDKLVIVDHNQLKPITVIQVEEVEGLQRGEDDISYDQEMYTDRAPENRETSKHMKLENSDGDMLSTQADSSAAFETVFYTASTENNTSEEAFDTQLYTEGPESAEHNDTQSEQISASNEEFIQLNPSSEKPARLEEEHTTVNPLSVSSEEGSTTENDFPLSSVSSEASGDEVYETQYYTEGPGASSSETTEGVPVSSESLSTSTRPTKEQLPTDDMTTHRKTYIEDDEHDLIPPGFQPIPEDFSLPLQDQPAMMESADEPEQHPPMKGERRDDTVGEKILSEVFELRPNSTSTTTEVASTSGDNEATNSPAWLKEEDNSKGKAAPGEPLLVPYWERNNTANNDTSSSSSEEEFSGAGSLNIGEFHVLKMSSDEYMDGFEGSGHNATKKEVEETTLAPSKLLQQDIDAPDSGSSSSESDSVKHNPKNDVESVKYDENENNTAEEALPKQIKGNV